MVPKLNFKLIEAFRSVMASGSVVGAAKLMNVAQPGVSRAIGTLEMRLGFDLFVRRGRRLAPTPEAEALYREIEHLYRGLEGIGQLAQDIRYQRAGALRVATMPALAQGLVPRAIARFVAKRPQATVFVQSMPSRQIVEMVSTRQFDVGIVETPFARPAIVWEPLPTSPTVAVVPATHRLAHCGRISIKDLDGERIVLLSHGSFVRFQIEEAFSKFGVALRVGLETPSSSIACALVAAGAGITLVARVTAEPFIGSNLAICTLDIDLPMQFALVYPQLPSRMLLADAFAADVRHEFGQAGAGS